MNTNNLQVLSAADLTLVAGGVMFDAEFSFASSESSPMLVDAAPSTASTMDLVDPTVIRRRTA